MITYAPFLRSGDLLLVHDYPGEVNDKTLAYFATQFPYMHEIESWEYRAIGISLWRKE
jgi:hypothetical protein